jgi:hypothetical protein
MKQAQAKPCFQTPQRIAEPRRRTAGEPRCLAKAAGAHDGYEHAQIVEGQHHYTIFRTTCSERTGLSRNQ